jgi:F420-non-reducing hydrogenase iron-sulfur subunit
VNYLCGLLDQVGLGGERIRMTNLSAAMGARFAEIATDMVEKVRELGPNPLREDHGPGGKL